MKILRFVIFGIVLLQLVSCQRGVVYQKNAENADAVWHEDSIKRFTLKIDDTLQAYNVLYTVENNDDYNYSNLFLFTKVTFPNGSIIRDTLEMVLAAPNGKWIGKGWFGTYKTTFPFRQNIRFPYQGTYTFEVLEAMRSLNKKLDGIVSFGMTIKYR